jgi:hypothetical protein
METDLDFLIQMDKVGEPFGESIRWLSYDDFCRLSELLKNTEHPLYKEIDRIATKVDTIMGVHNSGLVCRLGPFTILR